MKIDLKLLKKLSETPGVSGSESRVRRLIETEIEKYVDSLETDDFGNLIAVRSPKLNCKCVQWIRQTPTMNPRHLARPIRQLRIILETIKNPNTIFFNEMTQMWISPD
jgi:hypothetical protein